MALFWSKSDLFESLQADIELPEAYGRRGKQQERVDSEEKQNLSAQSE